MKASDQSVYGLHHISIISGDARQNADFYVQKLGLRFIAKSVNQDDPGNPHLFYGNGQGAPGSEITFFPWPRAIRGKAGTGEATAVSFGVPSESAEYWFERLEDLGISHSKFAKRFSRKVLTFHDPDGLRLELVFDTDMDNLPAWEKGPVPEKYGIRGFWGATLQSMRPPATREILEHLFDFREEAKEGDRCLLKSNAPIGSNIIMKNGPMQQGKNGRGIIHHLAFRTNDVDTLKKLREQVRELGLQPTEIIDRHFFHSVYFREPGGILFEMATEGPGFGAGDTDEPLASKWVLPPWMESRRESIERQLPDLPAF